MRISAGSPLGVRTIVNAPLAPSTGSRVLKLRSISRLPAPPVAVASNNQAVRLVTTATGVAAT